ncbi:MAG: GDSL-type esterase/lipase family protein [Candidatus Eiseniibacteriota bacterium]
MNQDRNSRVQVARRTAALVLAIALAAGCSSLDPIQPATTTGSADFSRYVAIGTSISMGIQNAGLVEDFQVQSFPSQLARQTGANGGNFVQPLVADPGISNFAPGIGVLELTGFVPGPVGPLPVIQPRPGTPPTAPTTPRPANGYHNLGISGALVADALAKTSGNPPSNYFDIVLQGQGPMITQALNQNPTFITVELGVNDVVGGVLLADPSFIVPPAIFQTLYTQLLDSIATRAPNAKLALANIPSVTDIPFATTIPIDFPVPIGNSVVFVRLKDASGDLPDGSLVILTAQDSIAAGVGLTPGRPLPDDLVITPDERTQIDDAVRAYNVIIAALATARGAALADEFALFENLRENGLELGGTTYSFDFVSGGLFSLDGVHPSSLGYALLANEFIRAINSKFGATIPDVDLRGIVEPALLAAARE